jgi:diguanylate cyclase (GGDEF)-like protein
VTTAFSFETPGTMDTPELLSARIAELEGELAEASRQSSAVFVLQQVLSTMAASLDIDDLLAIIIRGIGEALSFPRVVMFDRPDGEVIAPRLVRNPDGSVARGDDLEYRTTDFLREVAEGRAELALGDALADESPLPDASGPFCIVPLTARDTVQGLFYVDLPSSKEIDEFELGMLLIFASQAAIAIDDARLIEHTRQLALTDPLTGVANRRGLEVAIERDLNLARRGDEQRGFLVFDLDDFKRINDTEGHAEGDRVLREFAEMLVKTARVVDIVARYAGDEFVVVLHKTDRELAEVAVARILHALNGAGFQCSIGVAIFPRDGNDWTSLFAAADRALYRAKANGRNQFAFCDVSRSS